MSPYNDRYYEEPDDCGAGDFADEADYRYDQLRDNIATGTASPFEEAAWERMQREKAERDSRKGGA